MLLAVVKSVNKVLVRLTKERWEHIKNSHPEISEFKDVLEVISNPDMLLKGDLDELLAVKKSLGTSVWFVVPYKEVDKNDGFILTAYLTTDISWLLKKEIIWNKD